MTEHEHAEVSRSLALAIGWKHDDVQMVMAMHGMPAYCEVWPWGKACGGNWKPFDYRDIDVIWPIAERFNCFPSICSLGWISYFDCTSKSSIGDTAALAVARAVIAAKEKT